MTALNIAREHQLRFGPGLLYSYGPWGALDYPQAVSRFSLVLGTGFQVLTVAVGWAVFHRALRTVIASPVAAALAAWLVVVAVASTTPSALLVSAGALGALYFIAWPALPADRGCRPHWQPAPLCSRS